MALAQHAHTLDMTRGSPVKLMLRFALPMLVGSVFQSFYTLVDSAVLGRFVGAGALAAIGATGSTTHFLLLLSTGVTSAISIVLSQTVGAGDKARLRAGIAAAGYLTLVLGLGMGLLALWMARPLMELLDAPEDIIDQSVLYIRLICGCGIATFAYNAVASILRALGDSKTPLVFLVLCSLMNGVLDLVAVLGLGMGVAGVAVATVLSQALSAVACTVYMFRRYPELALHRSELRPDWRILRRIFGIGAQMAVQNSFLSLGMMVITRVINGYGSEIVAAFTVGSNVQNLATILFSNFAMGFSVYVGQNYGAGLAGRIHKGLRQIFWLVGALSLVSCGLSLCFARPLVTLYIGAQETAVVSTAISFVRIQACFFPFLGWIWLYNSTLRGLGKISVTMLSSFVELASKIGFSLLLPIWFGYTGIWYAAPIGWLLGMLPDVVYYHRGRWQQALSPCQTAEEGL